MTFGLLQLVLGLFVTVIFFYVLLTYALDDREKPQEKEEDDIFKRSKLTKL
jgi:hypothetical protein